MNLLPSIRPQNLQIKSAEFNVPLKKQDMPASLVGQTVLCGAKSDVLNPPNLGQGKISRTLGKPLRFLARLIYIVAVHCIVPFFGVAYHLTAAAVTGIRSKVVRRSDERNYYTEVAKGHLEAFARDLLVIACLGMGPPPGKHGAFSLLAFASNSRDIAAMAACYFNTTPLDSGYKTHQDKVFEKLIKKAW